MLHGGQEVIIGAVNDLRSASWSHSVSAASGQGAQGHHVPLNARDARSALSMLDGIAAAEILKGVRGAEPVHRDALRR
jgi:hypothetical protein